MAEQSLRGEMPYASLFLASRAFRQAAEEFCAAAEALQVERERVVNAMNRNIRRYTESLENSSQQERRATGNTTERGNVPEATGSGFELARPFGSLHQVRHHAGIARRNDEEEEEEEEESLFNDFMRHFEARVENNRRQEATTSNTAERQDRENNSSNPFAPSFHTDIQRHEATTRHAFQDTEEEGSDISEHTRTFRQALIDVSNLAGYLLNNNNLDDEDLQLPSREAFFATGILSLNASPSRPTEACPICIEDIDVSTTEAREAAVVVVRCGHMYHRECVMRWFNELHPDAVFGTDPLCRQRLFMAPETDGDWYNEEGDEDFTEDSDEDGAGDDYDDDDGYDYGGYYSEEDIYDEYEDDAFEASHQGLLDLGPSDGPSLIPAPYGTQASMRNDLSRLVHLLGERSRLELRHRLLLDSERRFLERNEVVRAGTETVEWNETSGTSVRIRRATIASMQEDEDEIRRNEVEIEELTDRLHAQVNEL